MKISEILKEKIYDHADNTILEKIKTECSDAYNAYMNDRTVIYRGCSQVQKYLEANPQNGQRKSANTTNYYTVALSQLPAFKDYPPRDRSLICSTSKSYAEEFVRQYSGVYAVFPVNGTKIGMINDGDMWDTYLDFCGETLTIERVNYRLRNYFSGICLPTVTEQLEREKELNLGTLYRDYISSLDPKVLGFSVKDTSSFYKQSAELESEVWFSGKAYMVRK